MKISHREDIREANKLIIKAQILTNSHFEIQAKNLMKEKGDGKIKGLEEFKQELSKHLDISQMSDSEVYQTAHSLVIKTIKEGL